MELRRRTDEYAAHQVRTLLLDLKNQSHGGRVKGIEKFKSYIENYRPEVSIKNITSWQLFATAKRNCFLDFRWYGGIPLYGFDKPLYNTRIRLTLLEWGRIWEASWPIEKNMWQCYLTYQMGDLNQTLSLFVRSILCYECKNSWRRKKMSPSTWKYLCKFPCRSWRKLISRNISFEKKMDWDKPSYAVFLTINTDHNHYWLLCSIFN